MMFRQERFCNMIEVLFGESEAASMKAAKCRISVNKTVPPSGEVSGWIERNRFFPGMRCAITHVYGKSW